MSDTDLIEIIELASNMQTGWKLDPISIVRQNSRTPSGIVHFVSDDLRLEHARTWCGRLAHHWELFDEMPFDKAIQSINLCQHCLNIARLKDEATQ